MIQISHAQRKFQLNPQPLVQKEGMMGDEFFFDIKQRRLVERSEDRSTVASGIVPKNKYGFDSSLTKWKARLYL